MIKTILFDFGNVLAFFDHYRAVRQMVKYTDQTAEQLIKILYYDNLEYRYECGQLSTRQVYEAVREHGHLRCNQAEFVAMFCDIFWPNPPMSDFIPRLKEAGYKLVVASNTNDAHYTHYRKQFAPILKNFDAIAVSHEAGARKPERRFFEYAHQFVAGDLETCLFVDDLKENIDAAITFGWKGIQYHNFDQLTQDLVRAGVQIP